MAKRYYDRDEVISKYRAKIADMLKYFEGSKSLTLEELKAAYQISEHVYTDTFAKSLELRKKIKNSTLLKNHYKKKRAELQSTIDELHFENDALATAIELCEILKLNDSSSFTPAMLNDELLNKIVDYKIEAEKAHNEKVEKTGEGKKSKKYAGIYEEFDESQYPFLNME